MRSARLPIRTLGMAVVLAALVVMTVVPAAVAGGPTKAPQAGPVTEGFVQSMIGVTGGFGKRPNPVPFTLDATATARAARRALPPYFSLIDEGRLTAVRNQGDYGTCWAFANLAAVESRLRPGQTWDFSEDNLVTRSGFGPFGGTSRYDWGGWDLMAIAYLTRWAGPVNQSDDPYHTPTPPRVNRVRKHVQGAVMIPGRSGDLDNDLIKQLVMANGALSVGMFWDDNAYNGYPYTPLSAYATHYLPTAEGENHGVDVVGWKDDFPAANFAGSNDGLPPGDGAFLVRNSWGKGFGNYNGYFWVSYYDQSFARDQGLDYGGCTSYSNVSSAGNYHRQYSYDKLGATAHYGYNASQVGAPTASPPRPPRTSPPPASTPCSPVPHTRCGPGGTGRR
jgi:C1A family cysteine protease